MGRSSHLPGVRNQLAGNHGRFEYDTLPDQYFYGIGRPALLLNGRRVSAAGVNDSHMRNVLRYLDDNNPEPVGRIVEPKEVALRLLSPEMFVQVMSDIERKRSHSNRTSRRRIRNARDVAVLLTQSMNDLLAADAREALGSQSQASATRVDVGPQARHGDVQVALRSRYCEATNGVLGAQLDLSDKPTWQTVQEASDFINSVFVNAGLPFIHFDPDEMDTTIPLFRMNTEYGKRDPVVKTPDLPRYVQLYTYGIHT